MEARLVTNAKALVRLNLLFLFFSSTGDADCQFGTYDYWTDVAAYEDWIREVCLPCDNSFSMAALWSRAVAFFGY